MTLTLTGAPERFQAAVAAEAPRLRQLARVEELEFLGKSRAVRTDGEESDTGRGAGATAILRNGSEVFLPLAKLVDLKQERTRLQKEIQRLDGQLTGAEKKLANEQFTRRAPAEVVAKEREKAVVFRDQRDKLQKKLQSLGVE